MEKAVNNENVQTVPSAEENVSPANVPEETAPATNVNKLFNIVTLAYAGVLLAAQIFLFISLFFGIFAVDGVVFTYADITHAVTVILQRNSATVLSTLIPLLIFAVLFIIVVISVLVGLIKTAIRFFKFIKLGEEYETREALFGKYVRTVSRSYGNAIVLIVGSLAVNKYFTALGSGVIAVGCIIYFLSSAIVILFKDVLDKEKKFDLLTLLVDIGKKLVMFMLVFLLVANVKESLNVALENLLDFRVNENDLIGMMYFNCIKPIYIVIPYCCVFSIVSYVVKYYPLNNGKKDVNLKLRSSFIALLVVSVLFAVADCVVYGMAYGGSVSGYLNLITEYWLAFVFVSVAGIVLTLDAKKEKEVIRG